MKTILLTGATDGIGLEAAKKFAAAGHQLFLHGRSDEKLQALLNQLSKSFPNAGNQATTFCADLSDLKAVLKLAAQVLTFCKNNNRQLDVIINNAGVFKTPNTVTETGFDIRFVVNTFAPVLLTNQLLPALSQNGRIVNLSSAAQESVDLDLLQGKTKAKSDFSAYAQSKLAITQWSAWLATQLPAGQSVVALNPGSMLGSKMVKEGFGVAGKDLNIGADIIGRSALDDSFSKHSGEYFDNDIGDWGTPHADALIEESNIKISTEINAILKRFK